MAEINFPKLIADMIAAAKTPLVNQWGKVKPYAKKEIESFVATLKLIATLKVKGEITEDQAKIYLDIAKSSMRIVLLSVQGLGIIAVESAINAAIGVIRDAVNTAIGWVIL